VAVDGIVRVAGLEGDDAARRQAEEWCRVRLQHVRTRRPIVGGHAIVVTAPGHAELRPIERLAAGPGEVTVEALVTAISPGTERAQWLRLPNAQPVFPYIPGYSGSARVIAVGPDIVDVSVGDRVAVARLPHVSVATVPASWTTPVPADVDIEHAALVYLAMIAAYGVRRAGVRTGAHVCVVGAGTIGSLASRFAALAHPGSVTVIATTRRREKAALAAGATSFLLASAGGVGIDANIVIEATGDPEAIVTAIDAAAPGATVVLLGSPRGVTKNVRIGAIRAKRLRVVGAHISALAREAKQTPGDPFAEIAREFLAALADGSLDVSDLIGSSFDPREPMHAYRALVEGLGAGVFDWRRLTSRAHHRQLRALPQPATARSITSGSRAHPAPPQAAPRPMRFLLVGCGDIGLANARGIAGAANAQLAVCHDTDVSLAGAVASRFGCDIEEDLDAALDPARVDAVLLAVPHDLHAPLVARAASSGLHVVVEKPLAVDLDAARTAAAAAEHAGVALSVCFPYRYEPPVAAARAFVQAGALGQVTGAAIVYHADKPPSYWRGGFSGRATSDWRASRRRAGGGVLIMNVTHYIDWLRHITGAEPVSVMGAARYDDGDVEDGISVTVELRGGGVATIVGSSSSRGAPPSRFETWGDAGTVVLEPDAAIYSERAVSGLTPGRWSPLPTGGGVDVRAAFIDDFAVAVAAGRTPPVPVEDGLAVQRFVEAVYLSVARGGRVSLEELDDATEVAR
jgi:2-desacetyl-2-hydroxyethyl bacteriochlorophyllide A dehydrogenase